MHVSVSGHAPLLVSVVTSGTEADLIISNGMVSIFIIEPLVTCKRNYNPYDKFQEIVNKLIIFLQML